MLTKNGLSAYLCACASNVHARSSYIKWASLFDDACAIHKKRELFASTRIFAIKTKQRIIRKRKKKRHAKKISTSHTCFTMPCICIYSLLYALTTIPEILYIALNENLSIYSHTFIRTADLYTHRSSGQAEKCTLNVLFGRPLDTIGP